MKGKVTLGAKGTTLYGPGMTALLRENRK